ncbi:clavesin-1-like isoform X2 [Plodia interpunctella]|uniref:clavesin-1-like isoform X2 n=1 Tax=Plodia interpunctella TaxID=58824 RepID=UPI0023686F0A|nr:clavesin-1-like isoform X2 [Plodia interpunctella]
MCNSSYHVEKGIKMNDCFLEIAYEAELSTQEDPEMLELAEQECNENPATRDAAIQELRQMLYERGECIPLRTDDAYLLRFLRARGFVVKRAHRLMVRYYQFREQYPHLYKDVDIWELLKVRDAYEGTLYDRPDIGRLSIFKFGSWDPNEFPVEDLVKAGMLMTEIGLRQPKAQILGGTVIVDLEGVSLRHIATLSPTVAYQIVSLLGGTTPARVKSCHFINYSWTLNTFFYLFKRFIPRTSLGKIHFHGYDLNSLHKHIDPACLPPKYGGTCKYHGHFGTWLSKIKKYRDKSFDEDMKLLGYVVKE